MPSRIQMRRTKGWRKPEGAIYVGRGSRWGNPFSLDVIHHAASIGLVEHGEPPDINCKRILPSRQWLTACHASAIALYRGLIDNATPEEREAFLGPLRGCDLMCWCPPDLPCHADTLIELANG